MYDVSRGGPLGDNPLRSHLVKDSTRLQRCDDCRMTRFVGCYVIRKIMLGESPSMYILTTVALFAHWQDDHLAE